MEAEAIRSRTREALRNRVANGRIAGGSCFGYRLVRQKDPNGRAYTLAEIDPKQADIVRRIFREYVDGRGVRRIAKGLNDDGIASPRAGREGNREFLAHLRPAGAGPALETARVAWDEIVDRALA